MRHLFLKLTQVLIPDTSKTVAVDYARPAPRGVIEEYSANIKINSGAVVIDA
ncbi:hypothetical protein [Sphingobacterium corticis]|uniref:hypothetical protein n=1 Tax=Sphingobacterium corticis TaxID=1812823 RepID=UPI0036D431EE